jgi:acyl-CoA synthetase (AMP-forming)/AMP-acid ligase II
MTRPPLVPLPEDAPWRTMVELLTAVGARGAAPALTATSATGDVVRLTGEQLRDLVARGAALLASHGVGPELSVALHFDNRSGLEALVLHWATQWMGAVAVPVGTRLAPPEVTYIVEHADAVLVCSALDSVELAAGVVRDRPRARLLDISEGVLELTAGLPVTSPAAVSELALADVLYTSGTTARRASS